MFSIGRRRSSPPQVVPTERWPSPPIPSPAVVEPERTEAEAAAEHGPAVRRLTAAQVPSIEAIRISPQGADAVLVNISSRGLLSECRVALRPGTKVTVVFIGGFTPAAVSGRVARSAVARMATDGIRYEVAIAFDQQIELLEAAGSDASVPAAAEPPVPEAPRTPQRRAAVNRW